MKKAKDRIENLVKEYDKKIESCQIVLNCIVLNCNISSKEQYEEIFEGDEFYLSKNNADYRSACHIIVDYTEKLEIFEQAKRDINSILSELEKK